MAYGEQGKGPLAAVLVTDANANANEASLMGGVLAVLRIHQRAVAGARDHPV
jgi:hypothetical protein